MSTGAERYTQAINQMLQNKEHGSIAKRLRKRYMDACEANVSEAELWRVVEAIETEAVDHIKPFPGQDASPILVFEDRSGLQFVQFVPGDSDKKEGHATIMVYNMCNSDTFEDD